MLDARLEGMRALIQRHPALGYYLLTFAISWGGVLAVSGGAGVPATKEEFERLLPAWSVALVAGPAVSGIVLTALVDGLAGLRELRSRLLRWRVPARWYAAAILPAPAMFLAILLAMSAISPSYLPGILVAPDKAALLRMGVAVGLLAGICEELGWTGFAIPTLRKRYGAFATGLIAGVLWAAWHLLVKIWAADAFGLLDYLPADVFQLMLGLTAYRILMVEVWDHTRSVLIAMLMHFSLTASNIVLGAQAPGLPLAVCSVVLAVAWWVVIAGMAAARRRPHALTRA